MNLCRYWCIIKARVLPRAFSRREDGRASKVSPKQGQTLDEGMADRRYTLQLLLSGRLVIKLVCFASLSGRVGELTSFAKTCHSHNLVFPTVQPVQTSGKR